MPQGLDPTARYCIVLESDRGKNPEPTFYARYLTAREIREVAGIFDQVSRADGLEQCYEVLFSGLRIALVGWSNITDRDGKAIAFDLAALESVLTLFEVRELVSHIMASNSLQADTAKKSVSPSPSSTASSVNSASVGDASNAPAESSL